MGLDQGISERPDCTVSRSVLSLKSDETLVEMVRCGDHFAFATIVERYRRPLLGRSRRLVGPDAAEDVVQEAFVRLSTYLGQGGELRQLGPWLNRVTSNQAIDLLRRRANDPKTGQADSQEAEPRDERQPSHVLEERARLRSLIDGLDKLSKAERSAFVLRELEGLGADKIAERIDTNANNVYQLLHRARAKLREQVGVPA